MSHIGKCPKCDKPISSFIIEEVLIRVKDLQVQDTGYSLSCPICFTVISGGFNLSDEISETLFNVREMAKKIQEIEDEVNEVNCNVINLSGVVHKQKSATAVETSKKQQASFGKKASPKKK